MKKLVLGIFGLAIASICVLLSSSAAHAATYTVDSIGDGGNTGGAGVCDDGSGSCTFRAAIEAVNADGTPGVINFNIAGAGVHTINPATPLTTITEQVTINGLTQPGASCGTLTPANLSTNSNTPHTLLIEIDDSANGGFSALEFSGASASSSIVRGLVIGNVPGAYGINLSTADIDNTLIECNYIGTNTSGTAAAPIAGPAIVSNGGNTITVQNNLLSGSSTGISISGPVSNVTIQNNLVGTNASGTAAIANTSNGISVYVSTNTSITHNVVSGNAGQGISVTNSNDVILQGNFVGLAIGGAALGNGGDGITLFSSNNLTIGGTSVANRNNIAANTGSGLHIYNNCNGTGGSANSTTFNNYIGTKVDGAVATGYGNGGAGIVVNEYYGGCVSVYKHQVGGYSTGEPNIIAGNTEQGILIHQSAGFDVFSIAMLRNRIYGNGQFGIDLAADSDNNSGIADTDLGPNPLNNYLMSYPTALANYYLNHPVINSSNFTGNQLTINYNFNANQADNVTLQQSNVVGYQLDFYLNDATQDGAYAGYNQGKTYLGSFIVDGSVTNATHTFTSPVTLSASQSINAEATVLWTTPGPP